MTARRGETATESHLVANGFEKFHNGPPKVSKLADCSSAKKCSKCVASGNAVLTIRSRYTADGRQNNWFGGGGHTLFFVPVQYWWVVFLILGVVFAFV